jgi:hypothetical protein
MDDHPVLAPARELTPDEWSAAVKACQHLQEIVVAAVRGGRAAMWKLSEALYECEEAQVWVVLGYETKGEWLAQPEISLTRSTFDRMTRVWRRLIIHKQVDAPTLEHCDISKVDIVLPAIESHKATLKDALADVDTLGTRDLREKYQLSARQPAAEADDLHGQLRTSQPESGDAASPGVAQPVSDEIEDDDGFTLDDLVAWIDQAWTQVAEARASGAAAPRLDLDTLEALEFDRRTLAVAERLDSGLILQSRQHVLEEARNGNADSE